MRIEKKSCLVDLRGEAARMKACDSIASGNFASCDNDFGAPSSGLLMAPEPFQAHISSNGIVFLCTRYLEFTCTVSLLDADTNIS